MRVRPPTRPREVLLVPVDVEDVVAYHRAGMVPNRVHEATARALGALGPLDALRCEQEWADWLRRQGSGEGSGDG